MPEVVTFGEAMIRLSPPHFQRLEQTATLDVQVGGGRDNMPWEVRWPRVIEAVGRLTAAGATVIREDGEPGRPDHMVMADPEGNEFDLL